MQAHKPLTGAGTQVPDADHSVVAAGHKLVAVEEACTVDSAPMGVRDAAKGPASRRADVG